MLAPDKSPRFRCTLAMLCLLALGGCNRMATPPAKQTLKDAEARAASGDFLEALSLYEKALDGSTDSAEIHYKMALLYDDKMKEPLNALHHFKRYLTLAPSGRHAAEVKGFMKRDELTLVTTLSGDAVMSRAEAARLRNENLALRRQLDEKAAQAKAAAATEKASARTSRAEKSASPAKRKKAGNRQHVVEAGETLYSLSRKYYDTPSRWKEIREANSGKLGSGGKLRAGQTLTIP